MIRKGILYIMMATFFFTIMNLLAKYLSDLHVMQIVFYRSFGSVIFTFPLLLKQKVPILGTHRKLLLIRAVVGLVSLACFFLAIQRIPLGSAISIRYLGPMFGAFFAYKFLKEEVNNWQWLGFVIAFFGVVMLKGFDLRIDLIGLLLSIVSAFFVGIVFAMLRYLGQRENYLVIINYFMVVSLLVSLFFFSNFVMPNSSYEWLAAGFIGVFGFLGQIFMTRAFQMEETSVLAPFKYLELFYAIALGLIFFNEKYNWISLMAMLIIIGGMLLSVYAKYYLTRKESV